MPKSNTAVVTIGIDPEKNTLHVVGLEARGGIVLREKVARARIVSRLANVAPCTAIGLPPRLNGCTIMCWLQL